jgi:6-methylsalicylate decarboxylase
MGEITIAEDRVDDRRCPCPLHPKELQRFDGRPVPPSRLDQQGQRDHPNLAEPPSVTAKKFLYDTVCYGSKAAFTCALEAFGADHLVTGSDYPVLQDYEAYKETFGYIERLGLPQADVDKILHHNAQAMFGFAH